VLHDLRRTARALMSRAKVPADIGERALGHKIPGVRGRYDPRAEYQPQVDEAIASVTAEVEKILETNP
jgi:integrase